MLYYIKHFFDPDLDHLHPASDAEIVQKKGLDLFNLGYVQNVVKGQILAEIVPLDPTEEDSLPDQRFVTRTIEFPAGQNTFVHPKYPQFLLAATNGYVFYHEKRITVKSLLNVRQDISFRTGNINFVGDMAVHGSVRSGFSILGNNIRIMGMIEGGIAHATQNMIVDGGARGNVSDHCLIDAGGKLLANFLEGMEARVSGNVVVNKYCLNCDVYGGNNLLVKENLNGGNINICSSIYVGKKLGNEAGNSTVVLLGYDPDNIRRLHKIESFVAVLSQNIMYLNTLAPHISATKKEVSRHIYSVIKQRDALVELSKKIPVSLIQDFKTLSQCRLICPGTVYPGVKIFFGDTSLTVNQTFENVLFRLDKYRVVVEPIVSAGSPEAEQNKVQAAK